MVVYTYICDQDGGEVKSTRPLDGGVSPSLGAQSSGLLDGPGGSEEVPLPELQQSAVPPQNGSEVPPPEVPQPAVPAENGSEVPPPVPAENGSEVPPPEVPQPAVPAEISEEPQAGVFLAC